MSPRSTSLRSPEPLIELPAVLHLAVELRRALRTRSTIEVGDTPMQRPVRASQDRAAEAPAPGTPMRASSTRPRDSPTRRGERVREAQDLSKPVIDPGQSRCRSTNPVCATARSEPSSRRAPSARTTPASNDDRPTGVDQTARSGNADAANRRTVRISSVVIGRDVVCHACLSPRRPAGVPMHVQTLAESTPHSGTPQDGERRVAGDNDLCRTGCPTTRAGQQHVARLPASSVLDQSRRPRTPHDGAAPTPDVGRCAATSLLGIIPQS